MNAMKDSDRDSLEIFLAEYECHPPAKLSKLLPELLEEPLMLELVLSSTEAPAAWIRAAFPASPLLLPTALNGHYPRLIARLARVPLLPVIFERDTARDLDDASKDMLAALAALAALADVSFASEGGSGAANNAPEDAAPAFAKARQKQGSKKRAQRAAAASSKSALDPKPFEKLGVGVPHSQLAAGEASVKILAVLKDRFMNMLACLKRPECVAALEKAYLDSAKASDAPTHAKVVGVVPEEPPAEDTVAADSSSTLEAESIKPALYFDNAAPLGPWHILISSRADRDLRKMQREDAKMFSIVLKKIKELSFGHFSDDNQKRLTGRDTAVPIYEAKMTRDTRLVYRVDIISEYGSKDEHQVLSIYGIYKHKELERGDFWTAVGLQLARKGPEYRSRCLYRSSPANKNDKVYAPATFPLRSAHVDNDADLDAHAISIPLEDQDELHELLDLEKFVVFSQALLNSIIANIDVTHPFDTSSEEKRIIEHPYSCYVLGRSGTGKTTTMVFRMLGHERAWRMHKDTMRRPRQLFVTQSPMLAGKVEDYFRKLLDSLEISEYKPRELKNHSHIGAGKAPRYIFPDADDSPYGSELPRRFSQLQDEHFPLFTTFEKLSQLIEADVDAPQPSIAAPGEDSSVLARRNVKRPLVTYQAFRSTYWPHFPEDLTKGLDSALVYSEIMGVVKGSEESLYTERKFLDQETYESFSSRRQSVFASERSRVYAIFSAYERRRIEQGHIDAADRAHAIIRALQKDKGIIGQRVNFLYVDEAQDNLLIDAMVLRMICSNPRGLFWAGDTAQTISVGSSFRFNDLRAFLHRVEEGHSAALGSVGAALPILNKNPPALFQLLVNYRSHGGIVSCAQAVISLLLKLWPNSIDNLGEERGVVAGARPVFLGNWDRTIARPEQPLFGPGNIEFGARQCVIVRSEEAQTKLKRDAGDIGIVMTVYESKGLEFDDVLLYNFFDDSTVSVNQWRVVLNILSSDDGGPAAPRFDDIRHAGVCAELKSLYVAITRARKKLWIFDRSEKSEPMKAVWTSGNLVETSRGVLKFAVSSTQEEWADQAKTLFDHERFLQARHCFERAGNSRMAAVANAFYLRTCADAKPPGGSKTLQEARAAAYATAGGAFLDCAQSAESTERQRVYSSLAGESFEKAGKSYFPQAAKCFEHADQYIRAAELYRDSNQFDDAVRLVQKHGLVRDAEAAPILTAAKLFYFNCGDTRKGCGLFERYDQAVEYLEARGLDSAQAAVLEMMERWSDAAEVHTQEGRLLPAAAAYLRSQDSGSALRARAVILKALWTQIALGRKPHPDHEDVLRLRELISQLCDLVGQAADIADEMHLFEALIALDQDSQVLESYIQSLSARRAGGDRLASNHLLALHAFLTAVEYKSGEGLAPLGSRLDMTLNYVRLLRDRLTDGNALANSAVQQVFGFRLYSDRTFILLSGTHLHREAVRTSKLAEVGDGVVIMEDELASVFKTALLQLIKHKVDELQVMLEQARALTEPCLQMFLGGACRWNDCRQEHIAADGDTAGYYNRRVRAHVAIISILAAVDGIVDRDTVVYQERTWTRRLYDALRPSTPLLGNPALLDVAQVIPQESRTLSVLHAWIRPHLHILRVRPENVCTFVMQCAWMFRTFNVDLTDAQHIMYGAPIVEDADYAGARVSGTPMSKDVDYTRARVSGADRDVDSEFGRNRIRMTNTDGAPLLLKYMLNGVLAPSGEKRSFLHGVEFFGRILENGPSVDIGVLCDYFEDVTACLIMSWHLGYTTVVSSAIQHSGRGAAKRTTPVTLPRSWCLAALERGLANRFDSPVHLKLLVEFGGRFISILRKPKQECPVILYHGKPLTVDSPKLPKDLVIGRICLGLCLMAYNFDMELLRRLVLGITRELRWRSLGTTYESYTKARDWSELSNIIRQSLAGSRLDCMVWVARRRGLQRGSIPSIPEVAPVVFKTLNDLAQQLRAIVPGQPSRLVELQALNAQSKTGLTKPDMQHTYISRHLALDETANDSDEEDELPSVEDQTADPALADLDSARHHAAATLIERAFRRRLAGGTRNRAHSIFKICLASPYSASSSSSYYRKLFLGPLPHVLACLHGAETQVHQIKTTLRKELQTAEGHTLEQLDNQLTAATQAYKRIQGFRRTLKPDSNFHIQQNVLELEHIVADIDAFIRGLPATLPEFDLCNLDKDLNMGWRGISAKQRAEPEYEDIGRRGEQEMERRATPE